MPRIENKLTDTQIRNAKPTGRTHRLWDGGGLYLEVSPAGGRWWRWKYRWHGRERRLSLGVYPDVSLKDARERRDEARRQLANGIDPSQHRKATKRQHREAAANTFEAVAREWYAKHRPTWSEGNARITLGRLENDLFPWLGSRPISEIDAAELLEVIQRIERRGALQVARRALRDSGRVFRYAIATRRARRNPAADLKGMLPPEQVEHRPAITNPERLGELLRAIDGYWGSPTTRCALQLLPHVFVRPGELRRAEWNEIDFEEALWLIPAAKMKMRREHLVPLSKQALAILRELHPLTGRGTYLFPNLHHRDQPLSDGTLNSALLQMGFSREEMTPHGLRSTASTLLHDQGWPSAVIERQLAHVDRNRIRSTYNRAEHLPERTRMMQAWSDYLDSLRDNPNKVVPLHRKRAHPTEL